MTAFPKLYKITRDKIQCFLHAGMGLHLGTFYGLLFESYFHSLICERGYKRRMRLLKHDAENSARKRTPLGFKKSKRAVKRHEIPKLVYNQFHKLDDISPTAYNVPDGKNFAAVDALAPSLGEMYQITSAEKNPIKANHLNILKPHFKSHIDAGKLVKLVFIVPPSRFDEFTVQSYVDTSNVKSTITEEVGRNSGERFSNQSTPRSAINTIEQTQTATRAELEASGMSAATGASRNGNVVMNWVEQYVMEVDVSPMKNTFDRHAEEQLHINPNTVTEALVAGLREGLKPSWKK